MRVTREEALQKLESYVNMPSGSQDQEGVDAFVRRVQSDFEELGMKVVRGAGNTLECTAGVGENELLLMGHMDTVFARAENWPFRVEGDRAYGPGCMDMKGGLLVMYYALREIIPQIPANARVVCVLNSDEEIGSGASAALIEAHARKAFAALSYEPLRSSGALVSQRKGVISFEICCTGKSGHAGSAYLQGASAIQQLCSVVNDLYTIRDDARDISINIGTIGGGTAKNIIADEARASGEIRFYDPAYTEELLGRLKAICEKPGVTGTHTILKTRASHPPFKANEKSARLLGLAQEIGRKQGRDIPSESTGGAGDIAFAGLQGIASLDGLGIGGEGAHTKDECAYLDSFLPQIELSAALIQRLLENPNCVR